MYLVGVRRLSRGGSARHSVTRTACFLGGLTTIGVAIASPLDAFGSLRLSVHMTQHLLLMMIAPPLIWLGAPVLPLLHGLPRAWVRDGLGPFLAWPALQRAGRFLGHPVVCWSAFVLATWIWHVPALYELALRSPTWHEIEHAVFLGTGLMFWWPVVRPWPARRDGSPWIIVLYLLLADIQNTVFSAIFTFAGHVIYPSYELAPQLGARTALDDQVTAGVIMWVPGSFVFLAPLFTLVVRALSPAAERARQLAAQRDAPDASAVLAAARERAARPARPALDLLTVPGLAALARPRIVRTAAQLLLFGAAAVVVVDGLLGPAVSPLNLAGVLPWTGARALLVLGLLVFGGLFCWACPFTLPRRLAERVLGAGRAWPRALRNRWLAVVLIVAFLWAYEALSLWDRPVWTAALVLVYFVGAFVIDGMFRGAAFCKWVCPLGQFQFVNSVTSPFEVTPRSADVCSSCSTHDCLRGRAAAPGCALDLFLPEKAGSQDCTFCMDCVRACPHDNVAVAAVAPVSSLRGDPERSGVGRLSRRGDLAVLALVLVFGGALNAAAMVAPVQRVLGALADRLGLAAATPQMLIGGAVVVALVVLIGVSWLLAQPVGAGARAPLPSTRAAFCRLAWALVPLGFAMWLSHFVLHLATGWGAVVPATARALADVGWRDPGSATSLGAMAHAMTAPDGLLSWQILALDAGLLLSLLVAWRIVRDGSRRFLAILPFALFAVALWAFDVWVLFQPMQMRGTMG